MKPPCWPARAASAVHCRRFTNTRSRYLLGVALRIVRDRALAEDVLHDAFLNLWNRAASFDPARGAARGWIYTVVRHTALNRIRAMQHEVSAGDDLEELADAPSPPSRRPTGKPTSAGWTSAWAS
jgi:RNA polymerase sigma factor (sigma-70 family)